MIWTLSLNKMSRMCMTYSAAVTPALLPTPPHESRIVLFMSFRVGTIFVAPPVVVLLLSHCVYRPDDLLLCQAAVFNPGQLPSYPCCSRPVRNLLIGLLFLRRISVWFKVRETGVSRESHLFVWHRLKVLGREHKTRHIARCEECSRLWHKWHGLFAAAWTQKWSYAARFVHPAYLNMQMHIFLFSWQSLWALQYKS